jgi:hypothetical protein
MSETVVVEPGSVKPAAGRPSSTVSDDQLIAVFVDRVRGRAGCSGSSRSAYWTGRSPTTSATRSRCGRSRQRQQA